MSRAYRIRVGETLRRVIRAEDCVSTQLELLEVLPADQMAELLAAQLAEQGFDRDGDMMTRRDGEVTISVDINSGTVSATIEAERDTELEAEREGSYYDDWGLGKKKAEKALREELKKDLQQEAQRQTDELREELTDRLEQSLVDIKQQLDRAVNGATAEALKQKAKQLGEIKQVTEDPESGSLTIVLEV